MCLYCTLEGPHSNEQHCTVCGYVKRNPKGCHSMWQWVLLLWHYCQPNAKITPTRTIHPAELTFSRCIVDHPSPDVFSAGYTYLLEGTYVAVSVHCTCCVVCGRLGFRINHLSAIAKPQFIPSHLSNSNLMAVMVNCYSFDDKCVICHPISKMVNFDGNEKLH